MTFSKEFKEEAMKLSDEIGVKKASEQLDIRYYTISEWRKNRKAKQLRAVSELTGDEQRMHILELERENAELNRANKYALGFFAISIY